MSEEMCVTKGNWKTATSFCVCQEIIFPHSTMLLFESHPAQNKKHAHFILGQFDYRSTSDA